MRRAIRFALPTASAVASKSHARDTCRAKTSTPPPSARPTGCPPNRPDWMPTDGLVYPCASSAQAAAARSTPTAPHSITQIASCSCKKKIKPPDSRRSAQLETESIYEIRSSNTYAIHAQKERRPDSALYPLWPCLQPCWLQRPIMLCWSSFPKQRVWALKCLSGTANERPPVPRGQVLSTVLLARIFH